MQLGKEGLDARGVGADVTLAIARLGAHLHDAAAVLRTYLDDGKALHRDSAAGLQEAIEWRGGVG